jgi:hypothetical protein
MWYCTSFLGREVARHPPPPETPWWGGRREPEKFADFISRFNIGKAKLRQRCDGGVLTPPPIEIIARRKVAPAFEPKKLGWMDGSSCYRQ